MSSLRRTIVAAAVCVFVLFGCTLTGTCPATLPTPATDQTSAFKTLKATVSTSVYIDRGFSPDEVKQITNGIRLWEIALGGQLSWCRKLSTKDMLGCPQDSLDHPPRSQRAVIFRKTFSNTDQVKDWDESSGKYVLGMTVTPLLSIHRVAWLVADRMLDTKLWMLVAAHEFGHSIGLEHVNHLDSLMSEYIKADVLDGPTPYDVREFCVKLGCDQPCYR